MGLRGTVAFGMLGVFASIAFGGAERVRGGVGGETGGAIPIVD